MSDPLFREAVFLVVGSFLLGGFSKGLIGLGMPVVVLAVVAQPLGVSNALAVLVLPTILTNIWQAFDGPHFRSLIARLWPFYLAAFVGVWTGAFIRAGSSETALLILLNTVLMLYAAVSLVSPPIPAPGRHERWMAPSAALTGGVMFGMVGNFIVPGILYLQALGLKRDMLVQSLGITFIVISSTLALSLLSLDFLSGELLLLSAFGVPAAFGGMVLGRACRRFLPEQAFRALFLWALLVAGVYGLVRAIFGW